MQLRLPRVLQAWLKSSSSQRGKEEPGPPIQSRLSRLRLLENSLRDGRQLKRDGKKNGLIIWNIMRRKANGRSVCAHSEGKYGQNVDVYTQRRKGNVDQGGKWTNCKNEKEEPKGGFLIIDQVFPFIYDSSSTVIPIWASDNIGACKAGGGVSWCDASAQLFSAIRVPETKNRRGHRSAAALHSCLSTFFVGARG